MKLSPADVLAFVEELHAAGLSHRVAWFGAIVRAVEGRRESDRARKAKSRGSPGMSADIARDISADNGRTEESHVGGRGGQSEETSSVRSQDQGGSLIQLREPTPSQPSGSGMVGGVVGARNVRGQTAGHSADALDVAEARVAAARTLLVVAYRDQWEKPENANDAWMSAGANAYEIGQVAQYVAQQPDMVTAAEEICAGFFADEWARSNRWPWKRLAKDPGRYRKAVKGKSNERAKAEYERIARQRDEAYGRGDHAEGKRLEPLVGEAHERAYGRAAG